jgi:trk system potassium uptake protein TrkH
VRVRRRRPVVDAWGTIGLVGTIIRWLSLTLLAPTGVALIYGDSVRPYLLSLAIAFAAGLAMEHLTPSADQLGVREGFLLVTLAWLAAAAMGALPYLLSPNDQLHHPVDAYFESMSGFTTTGASVLTDIEAVPKSLLFWRSLTQWLGGMGIVVLAMAILPRLSVGGQQLMDVEAPGPESEKLTPRIAETARRLWILYVALSVLEVGALSAVGYGGLAPGMDLFQSVTHTFGTMSTGGFSPDARSMEPFGAEAQWIVTVFMLVASLNFALMYRSLRRPKLLPRDEETRTFLLIVLVATVIVAAEIWSYDRYGAEQAIRHGAFQVASIISTTGFASTDFALWTPLPLVILIGLMFAGGCSGSTAGAIKAMRILLLNKVLRRELVLTVHPQAVVPIRLNDQVVNERTLRAIVGFVLIYLTAFVIGTVLILIDASRQGQTVSAFESISAAATTLGNVGPGVGFLGPMGSFNPFSDLSKIVMIALMWIGRLEVIPVMLVLSRIYWRP